MSVTTKFQNFRSKYGSNGPRKKLALTFGSFIGNGNESRIPHLLDTKKKLAHAFCLFITIPAVMRVNNNNSVDIFKNLIRVVLSYDAGIRLFDQDFGPLVFFLFNRVKENSNHASNNSCQRN